MIWSLLPILTLPSVDASSSLFSNCIGLLSSPLLPQSFSTWQLSLGNWHPTHQPSKSSSSFRSPHISQMSNPPVLYPNKSLYFPFLAPMTDIILNIFVWCCDYCLSSPLDSILHRGGSPVSGFTHHCLTVCLEKSRCTLKQTNKYYLASTK